MTGFQQSSPQDPPKVKPTGARHFRSVEHAKMHAAMNLGNKPFVVLSHPRWVEFAWVSPPEYAMPKALWGGIQIVEVVGR